MLWVVVPVQPARRRPRAQVRADLLAAAERLVRERGFRVSVDEIAAAAGMTKGAVYSNFANRAELMGVIAERLAPAPMDLDELVPPELPLAAAMERSGRILARRVEEHPADFVLILDLLSEFIREPELLRRAQESAPPESSAADRLQQRAQSEGRSLPRSAFEVAMVIDALALGLGVTRLLRGTHAVPDELFSWAFTKVVQPDEP
jgi:AcrR family transcriptional regulator